MKPFHTPATLFEIVKNASTEVDQLGVKRTPIKVLLSALTELGETAEEALIEAGASYKTAGPDGFVGECLDTVATLLDAVHVAAPNMTEQEIVQFLQGKMIKWVNSERRHVEEASKGSSTS